MLEGKNTDRKESADQGTGRRGSGRRGSGMGHPDLWKAYEVTWCLPTLLRLRGSLVCWVRGSQA